MSNRRKTEMSFPCCRPSRPAAPGAKHPRPTGRRSAFTLAEILVVVVILGIAAMVLVPMVSDRSSFQARAAARTLIADIMYAQNTAVTRQEDINVIFSPDSESYRLTDANGTLTNPVTKADYVVQFGQDNRTDRVDLVSADFNGSQTLTFNSLGAPEPTGGNVVISAGTTSITITVAPVTGRITISESE